MDYPSTLISSVSVTRGAVATSANKSVSCTNTTGRLTCVVYGLNQNTISDGVVAQVSMTVGLSVGVSSLTLQGNGAMASTGTALNLAASATNGFLNITLPTVTPGVSGLNCNPATLAGAGTVSCVVSLTANAPSGGTTINLSSNNSNVTVPATVVAGAGSSSVGFTATVAAVAANQTARLTASTGGSSDIFDIGLESIRSSISGNTGSGGAGATVTLSGAAGATTTADGSGNYTFGNLADGNYTITPSKSGTTFTPSSRSVTVAGASLTGVNFTSAGQSFSISGTLGTSGAGGQVVLSGARNATATANSSGNFTFSNLSNGSYTVTPNRSGVTFSPSSRAVTVNGANVTGVSFSGTNLLYTISGSLGASGNGATVAVSGGASNSVVADANGNFSISGLPNGTYTITPSKVAKVTYTFSPAAQSVTVNGANRSSINFQVAAGSTWGLSGNLGAAGAGATVTLSGAMNVWAQADSLGNYAFNNLVDGAYSVTPAKAGTNFSPMSRNISISGANQSGINFSTSVLTYGISGSLGSGGAGATVTLSGAASRSATADGSGNYSFTGLVDGAYTVTPAKNGVLFSPPDQDVDVDGANVGAVNFTALASTYSISGNLGAAGAGATVTLSGSAGATSIADSSGNYAFNNLNNGTYTVSPVKSGVVFTPTSRTVSINSASLSSLNFSSLSQSWSISGSLGTAGSGAIVNLTGAASQSVVANGSGNYTFVGLYNGTYTVTPVKAGIVFSPTSRAVSIGGASASGVNFSTQAPTQTWSISGTLGQAGSGVSMSLTGPSSAVVSTDAAGNYTFTGLANGTYTVTPSKAGYTFSPVNRSVTISSANRTGQDFTPTANLYEISGTLGALGNGAMVTVNGPVNRVVVADASGNYVVAGLVPGTYTVTPTKIAKVIYAFTPTTRTVTITNATLYGVNFSTVALSSSSKERNQRETRLVNAASGEAGDACSPGTVATLFGAGFTADEVGRAEAVPLPARLANLQVKVNGEAAPLLMVTTSKINFQCPQAAPGELLQIQVEDGEGRPVGEPIVSTMQSAAPGLFLAEPTSNVLALVARTNELGTPVQGGDILTILATGLGAGVETVPAGEAAPTDRVIGLKSRTRVLVGGVEVTPIFAGLAPGQAGVYQVNVQLPDELPASNGAVQLQLVVILEDGTRIVSNPTLLPIDGIATGVQ